MVALAGFMLLPWLRESRLHDRRVYGFLAATLFLAASPAVAQIADTSLWVTNGRVEAIVRNLNTIYIGGLFTTVGLASGGGAPVSVSSGSPVAPFPKVIGTVSAAITDGAGGWFI